MRITALPAIVLLSLAALSPVAGAAFTPWIHPDLSIQYEHGSFVGGGAFDSDPRYQSIALTGHAGATKTFLIRIRSAEGVDTLTISGGGSDANFDVTYLAGTASTRDITDQIVAGTYTLTDLQPTHPKYIRMIATAHADTTAGAGIWPVRATSVTHPDRVDAVQGEFMIPAVTTSARDKTGDLRCTASFPSATLTPGSPTGAIFSVKNISHHSVDTAIYLGTLKFEDQNGTVLGNTFIPYLDYFPFSQPLKAGHVRRMYVFDTLPRWPGTLTVTPACRFSGRHALSLPPVRMDVTVPGPTPRPSDAVDTAVAATGGLFDLCNPEGRGHDVLGRFDPPVAGTSDTPMQTRCWAEVTSSPGFDVVTLFYVTPQDVPPVEIPDDFGFFGGGVRLPKHESAEAGRWSFVVTANGAHSYGFATQSHTLVGPGRANAYEMLSGVWRDGGWGSCGFDGYALGWGIDGGYYLDWVNACLGGAAGPVRSRITSPSRPSWRPGDPPVVVSGA
jgi:hypothetical protein